MNLLPIYVSTTANKLEKDNPIKNLLIITRFGFILIYTVNQTTVIATAYPPYGLPTLSFIVLSVYVLCFGIYSSAISLSNIITLRAYPKTPPLLYVIQAQTKCNIAM